MSPAKKAVGMKEGDLRAAAICAICSRPFGQSGPLFWRVRLVRHGVDRGAVARQSGLTAMLGGHAVLAQVIGPDAVMTSVLSEREVTVCEGCAGKSTTVYELDDDEASR